MFYHSLVLIKVQLTFGTAKPWYNKFDQGQKSIPTLKGRATCLFRVWGERKRISRPRVHLHGTSKGLKQKT